MMESIILKDLDLSLEESRDIIEFLARKRNGSNYERMTNEELLSTLKKTPYLPQKPLKPLKMAKLEINQNLTLQKPIKFAKRKITQNLTPHKNLKLGKCKNTQNLIYEKPSKLTKRENLTPQK